LPAATSARAGAHGLSRHSHATAEVTRPTFTAAAFPSSSKHCWKSQRSQASFAVWSIRFSEPGEINCGRFILTRTPKLGSTPATGVAGSASRPALCTTPSNLLVWNFFERPTVFREGAENSARGGRAPFSISEFGIKSGKDSFHVILNLFPKHINKMNDRDAWPGATCHCAIFLPLLPKRRRGAG
jgi:hypothetical protein